MILSTILVVMLKSKCFGINDGTTLGRKVLLHISGTSTIVRPLQTSDYTYSSSSFFVPSFFSTKSASSCFRSSGHYALTRLYASSLVMSLRDVNRSICGDLQALARSKQGSDRVGGIIGAAGIHIARPCVSLTTVLQT